MRNVFFSLLLGILFWGCSEENPSNVFVNQSSEASSSSFFENYSSSANIPGLSSTETISFNNEISSSSWEPYSYGELVDNRDRQVYKTIKIGEQTWMAENLNFDYHNRYALTQALASPSSCYNNDPQNCAKYGRLYPWSTTMDSAALFSKSGQNCGIWSNNKEEFCKNEVYNYVRGACPENWHIPTESDVNDLVAYSKTSIENQNWMRHYWVYTEKEDDFSDVFSKYGFLWTSLEIDSSRATLLNLIGNEIESIEGLKQNAYFIRCVKDTSPLYHIEHGTMTDERDGQEYKTVKIGDQWWMAENLNYAYTKPTPQYYYGTSDIIDSASFCYNNEPDSCAKYGRLYTWEASMDCVDAEIDDYRCPIRSRNNDFKIRGVCPDKWHVPSVNEWKSLQYVVNYFATDLKSTEGWLDNGNGSDVVGFRILPTGYYINYLENFEFNFAFEDIGKKTCFWTLRQETIYLDCPICAEDAYPFCISSNSKDFSFNKEPKIYAFPVRCVKDQ